MKKTIIYIISFFLFLIPYVCVAANENTSFVIDGAKIIKKDTEDYINVYSEYLKNTLDIEYYVVAVNKIIDGMSLEEYADYIYETSNISEKSILIIISKEDREIRIKVGSELSEIITNETINDYLNNYFVPYLKTEEWDVGIKNGYSSFFKLICNYYEIDSEVIEVYDGNSFLNKNKSYIILGIVWITSIFSYVYNSYLKEKHKKKIGLKDNIILVTCLILNIGLLILSYYILPLSLFVVLISELILILNNLPSTKKAKQTGKVQKKMKNRGKKHENNKKKS